MNFEHLALHKHAEIPKKPKKFRGYLKTDRDHTEFYNIQIKKFDTLRTNYQKDKKDYQKFFDPNLIFKIVLNNKPHDQSFRAQFSQMSIFLIN